VNYSPTNQHSIYHKMGGMTTVEAVTGGQHQAGNTP